MSTARLMQEGPPTAAQLEPLGTNDLDFMTVAFKNGQLRIGGSLMKSSMHTGRLQKLILDASQQVAMISLQEIDVPVEINTVYHGKLTVKPTAGMMVLPLIAPLDVLTALGIGGGLAVKSSFNVEAMFGFLHELRVEEGLIYSNTGQQLLPSQCHALLCRLGSESSVRADSKACLAACAKLGIKGATRGGLLCALLGRVTGSAKRLSKCVRVLEERGYWIRLRGRVSSVCHPLPAIKDAPAKPLRMFSFNQQHDYPMAA